MAATTKLTKTTKSTSFSVSIGMIGYKIAGNIMVFKKVKQKKPQQN